MGEADRGQPILRLTHEQIPDLGVRLAKQLSEKDSEPVFVLVTYQSHTICSFTASRIIGDDRQFICLQSIIPNDFAQIMFEGFGKKEGVEVSEEGDLLIPSKGLLKLIKSRKTSKY